MLGITYCIDERSSLFLCVQQLDMMVWRGEGRFDTFATCGFAGFSCYILGTLFVMFYLLVDGLVVLGALEFEWWRGGE